MSLLGLQHLVWLRLLVQTPLYLSWPWFVLSARSQDTQKTNVTRLDAKIKEIRNKAELVEIIFTLLTNNSLIETNDSHKLTQLGVLHNGVTLTAHDLNPRGVVAREEKTPIVTYTRLLATLLQIATLWLKSEKKGRSKATVELVVRRRGKPRAPRNTIQRRK